MTTKWQNLYAGELAIPSPYVWATAAKWQHQQGDHSMSNYVKAFFDFAAQKLGVKKTVFKNKEIEETIEVEPETVRETYKGGALLHREVLEPAKTEVRKRMIQVDPEEVTEHVEAPAAKFTGRCSFTDETGERYGCAHNGGKLGYIHAEKVEQLPEFVPTSEFTEVKFKEGAWRKVEDRYNSPVVEAREIVVVGKKVYAREAY